MSYRFTKEYRLRTRRDYQRFTKETESFPGEWIVVSFRSGKTSQPRLGITVTRRYGKSHERNRFKRLVREAFRYSVEIIPNGLELLVRPRSKAHLATFSLVHSELLTLIQRYLGKFQEIR